MSAEIELDNQEDDDMSPIKFLIDPRLRGCLILPSTREAIENETGPCLNCSQLCCGVKNIENQHKCCLCNLREKNIYDRIFNIKNEPTKVRMINLSLACGACCLATTPRDLM